MIAINAKIEMLWCRTATTRKLEEVNVYTKQMRTLIE
jgi:hypothetical protein